MSVLARERLELLKDLCRLNRDHCFLEHLGKDLSGQELISFTDRAIEQQTGKKEALKTHKYSFENNNVEIIRLRGQPHRRKDEVYKSISDIRVFGSDCAKAMLSSKDLRQQRVHIMKATSDKWTADRKNRRRPFVDKAAMKVQKPASCVLDGNYLTNEIESRMKNANTLFGNTELDKQHHTLLTHFYLNVNRNKGKLSHFKDQGEHVQFRLPLSTQRKYEHAQKPFETSNLLSSHHSLRTNVSSVKDLSTSAVGTSQSALFGKLPVLVDSATNHRYTSNRQFRRDAHFLPNISSRPVNYLPSSFSSGIKTALPPIFEV